MMTYPGRKLSNALVVRKLDKPKVQIEINGQYISDFNGFIDEETTVVPIRPFITAMNANFAWDAATTNSNHYRCWRHLEAEGWQLCRYSQWEVRICACPLANHGAIAGCMSRFALSPKSLKSKVDWNSKLYRASVSLP